MGKTRGSSYYEKINCNTWSLAESAAIALGGHLVTINDSSENAWLIDNFATSNTGLPGLFIGFSDNATEGQWTWSSGETSLLQNGGAVSQITMITLVGAKIMPSYICQVLGMVPLGIGTILIHSD